MTEEYQSPLAKYALNAAAGADAMGLADTISGGVVATVVDAGTTLWNSFTPERMEVSTEDLLARIDQNALQVYNEHPDAVQFASFIAGSAAPIGLALKGMNLLRAGSKGVSWFSAAGKEARLAEVQAAYESGVGATERVRQAQRAVYKAAAANALADNVAAEAAIALSMSAHPYMEDYYKDLTTNFAINTAIGTTIGAIGSRIIAGAEVANVKAGVEKEAVSLLNVATAPVDMSAHAGVQLQQRMRNVDRIKDTLKLADDPDSSFTLTPFTKEHFKRTQLFEEARAVEAFQSAASVELQELDTATKGAIRELLKDPRFAGMDSVKFLSLSDDVPTKEFGVKAGLQAVWDFVTNKINRQGASVNQANTGVFSPVWGGFISKEEARNYATIADLGKSITDLEKSADKQIGTIARVDAGILHSVENTAQVQADFASALLHMESKSFDDLAGKTLAVAPDDLAAMKAVYLRLSQLAREGNDVSSIKVLLTKDAPTYRAAQIMQISKAGFPASYLDKIAKLDKDRERYQVFTAKDAEIGGLSENAKKALSIWLGSPERSGLREAAAAIAAPELSGVASKYRDQVAALKEVMHHPRSKAFRDELANYADEHGYVLLYRGMRSSPKGHQALESYTLNPGKASAFAKSGSGLRLYRVHVDDIVGTIEDFGTTNDPLHSNMEILVIRGKATRDNVVVDQTGKPVGNTFFSGEDELLDAPPVVASKQELDLGGLANSISTSTIARIKELQAMGMGFETIALRTGTSVETVRNIITTGASYIDASALIQFGTRANIEEALAPTNRALEVSTSLNKVPTSAAAAAMNASMFKNLDQQMIEYHLLASPSALVQKIGNDMLSDEARTHLSFIEDSMDDLLGNNVGNTFFRSADAVLEKLGPVGEFITAHGKRLTTLKNTAKEDLTTPLSMALSSVAKSDAAIIELSNALNIQAALSGKRIYKNGKFWQYNAGRESLDTLIKMEDKDFLAYANSVNKNGETMLTAVKDASGKVFTAETPDVRNALELIQSSGRELYHLKNVSHKAIGKGDLSDIGFWVPANNPTGKQIAYAFDKLTGKATMLMANTRTELNSFIERYKESLGDKLHTTDIITKEQQADYNRIAGRHDPMYMAVADASKRHGGSSALAEINTTSEFLADLVQGYDYYINRGIDDIARLQLNPIMDRLDHMSLMHNVGFSTAALNQVQRGATKGQDPGRVIKNILMGRSNLAEHEGWMSMQSSFQMIADRSLRTLSELIAPFAKKQVRTEEDWLAVEKEMRKRGIGDVFYSFIKGQEQPVPDIGRLKQAYLAQSPQSRASLTPRAVALMNAATSTMVLRFMELAQPLVNAMALPILTSGAINKRLAASYGGAALDPTARFTTGQAMLDGVALMNSKHGEKWAKLAAEKKLFDNDWRTVNGIFKDIRSLEPGIMSKAEELLDSKVIRWASKPADYSEKLVREVAFFTGVAMAKKAYPTLGDGGVITFARHFMDESIGNYAAAQRPAMFQGTIGMAMSLFQTYSLTLGQRLFRQIETRNWGAMVKMMAAQQTIFGTASLPGFHPISELIGARYSDDNFDITTSTFRAFDDTTAEVLLYGLPSQLVGLTTRGDIQPRLPGSDGFLSIMPAANILMQAVKTGDRLAEAAFQADENSGIAMLEALSLQSLNRPIARVSELLSGHSLDASGKLVSTAEQIYTPTGVLSRIFAARPIEEIKAREAMHLDSLYGALDREKRKKLTTRLKSYIANGTLNQEILEDLAYEYMRTGSPTGWRAAVNEAIAQSTRTGTANVREHLSKDSALMVMMDDLD